MLGLRVETYLDEFQENKKEVVVDYFGWKVSSQLMTDYLNNRLDADEDVSVYDKITKLWAKAHNVEMIKTGSGFFSGKALPKQESDKAFAYLINLFKEKGVKL